MRQFTLLDKIISQLDQALALAIQSPITAKRANPALPLSEPELSPSEIKHVIGLMRVNHAGEVAAQGLYQGQALAAHDQAVSQHMQQAADEEIDHLAWCRDRLTELGGRSSYLDPFWYLASVLIGTLAGIAGDQWSLGFIAETENQVSAHLENHLALLPTQDKKSARILDAMKTDEEQHARNALAAGAAELPLIIKVMMQLTSKLMVKTAYHL